MPTWDGKEVTEEEVEKLIWEEAAPSRRRFKAYCENRDLFEARKKREFNGLVNRIIEEMNRREII